MQPKDIARRSSEVDKPSYLDVGCDSSMLVGGVIGVRNSMWGCHGGAESLGTLRRPPRGGYGSGGFGESGLILGPVCRQSCRSLIVGEPLAVERSQVMRGTVSGERVEVPEVIPTSGLVPK